MSVQAIVILVFGFILVLIVLSSRGASLDKLEAIPGERTLYEEEGIKVEQSGQPRSVIFNNCLVRLTDYRIIIAQKTLGGKTYVLRYLISFNNDFRATARKSGAKSYLAFSIERSEVKSFKSGNAEIIQISLPDRGLTQHQTLFFVLQETDKFLKMVES